MKERIPSPSPDVPSPDADLFGWDTILRWLGFVLRAPLRHKALATAAFLVVFGVGVAAVFTIPYRYQVQATLLAGYPQANALAGSLQRGADAPTRAAKEVLLRRENLRAILETTGFVDQYMARRPWAVRAKDQAMEALKGKPRERDDLVEGLLDTLEKRLWVEVHAEGTVAITFQWWDPELARQIVAAAQDSFLEARRKAEVSAIGEAIAILEAQEARLEQDIELHIAAFEKKQQQLRADAPRAVRPVARVTPPDPAIARLREELLSKQHSLAEMESFRRQRLAQTQAELVQQETIYAKDHPAVVSTRRVLRSLAEPGSKAVELQKEIAALTEEVARRRGGRSVGGPGLDDAFLDARLRLDLEDPRLDFERQQLDALLRQLSDLRERIQGVQVDQETAEAAFRHRYSVVTPPQLPRGPIQPFTAMFLGGGLLGGLAFAFFCATAADVRSGRVIERWQLEQQLDLEVLAELEDGKR